MRYESPWMISIIPVRSFQIRNEGFSLHVFLDLLVAARTEKLEVTQKELSDTLIACALADENAAQLEKRSGCSLFQTYGAYSLRCRAEKLALDVEEKALITATLQREWEPKLS
jgi:hypothetical protein